MDKPPGINHLDAVRALKMIPAFLDGDLTGHPFAIANALKDVTDARAMMASCGFESRLVEAIRQTYAEAVAQGSGDRLMASLMEMHEARLGKPVIPRGAARSGA